MTLPKKINGYADCFLVFDEKKNNFFGVICMH